MKKILIPIFIIILLAGCSRTDKMDINIFFKEFNKYSNETEFDIKDAIIENSDTYYCRIGNGVSVTLFTAKNGVVCECSVASTKYDSDYLNAIYASITSFCNVSKEDAENIFRNKVTSQDNYKFYRNKTDSIYIYIIRSEKYYPESNTNPTLKSHK